MIEYRYTREFRRAAIAACAQKITAVQPTGDQSKKTAVIVMATTATATRGNQQLSLLRIWAMTLIFAQKPTKSKTTSRNLKRHCPDFEFWRN